MIRDFISAMEWKPHRAHVSLLSSSFYKNEEDDAPIKRCPKCKVYIERDEGCAQMMCKNCKHAFCWYCLESLDVSLYFSFLDIYMNRVVSFCKTL